MHAGRSNGPKIVGLAQGNPRLVYPLPYVITKKLAINNLPSLSAVTKPYLNLPCFTYKENCPFLLLQSPTNYQISMPPPRPLVAQFRYFSPSQTKLYPATWHDIFVAGKKRREAAVAVSHVITSISVVKKPVTCRRI
jgi:hypothetical protein